MVFLLHGEDSFRMRLRLGELVRALLQRAPIASGDLARAHEVRLGELVGVSLHDARTDPASAIALSGQAQGLFDAPDERRVVVVEHAEALRDYAVIAGFPREAGLVLVSVERLAAGRARRAGRARTGAATANAAANTLVDAVESAGGTIERLERIAPVDVARWIEARASLHAAKLGTDAVAALASAVGSDTERIEQEVKKLGAYAAGATVTAADVRALVSGAI